MSTFNLGKVLDQINTIILSSNRLNYISNINASNSIQDKFYLYQKTDNTEVLRAEKGKYFLTFTFYGTNRVYLVTQLDKFNGLTGQQEFFPFNRNNNFDAFLLKTPYIERPKVSEYLCFGTYGTFDNEKDCLQAKGVWDHPVVDSSECPFYRQGYNQDNGYCSVPPEYSLVGFRNWILKKDEN